MHVKRPALPGNEEDYVILAFKEKSLLKNGEPRLLHNKILSSFNFSSGGSCGKPTAIKQPEPPTAAAG